MLVSGLCPQSIVLMLELIISLHQLQQEISASGSTIWCRHMDKQIASICKSAFYHLHNIANIGKFLSFQLCQSLIHAFITLKLDYCNFILSGLSKNQTQRLQYVQNSAACLLTGTSKSDNITPILRQLHWFPVAERINYKILLVTFKSLHGMAPEYLCELVSIYNPGRTLRSSGKSLLKHRNENLNHTGKRPFLVLPLNCRTLFQTI